MTVRKHEGAGGRATPGPLMFATFDQSKLALELLAQYPRHLLPKRGDFLSGRFASQDQLLQDGTSNELVLSELVQVNSDDELSDVVARLDNILQVQLLTPHTALPPPAGSRRGLPT